MPGQIWNNQILYYDSQPESEFSKYIETHLAEIKKSFDDRRFHFCYFPELCKSITKEQILYYYPNWKGEPLQYFGNGFLQSYICDEDKDIGACLFRLFDCEDLVFSCFQLQPLSQVDWDVQMGYYLDAVTKGGEAEDNGIRFSISEPDDLYTAFEMSAIKYIADILSPGNSFKQNLIELLNEHHRLLKHREMGLISDWQNLPVWKK